MVHAINAVADQLEVKCCFNIMWKFHKYKEEGFFSSVYKMGVSVIKIFITWNKKNVNWNQRSTTENNKKNKE